MQIPEPSLPGAHWSVPLVTLLAAILLLSEGGTTGSAQAKARLSDGGRPGQASAGIPADEGLRSASSLVLEFLGEGHDVCQSGPSADPRDRLKVSFLIVTLPDPVDSRLDYTMDRHFDALQRALETRGFVLDRFDLPWPAPGATARGDVKPPRSSGEPGVVLFRARTELLVLFIVGETVTSGIDKQVFLNTLEQTSRLRGLIQDPTRPELGCLEVEPGPIRILGPTFSGSTMSLERVIRYWRQGGAGTDSSFRIVSGSATAFSSDHGLAKLKDVEVSSMVSQDHQVLRHFLEYLDDRGVAARSVAVLGEGNTGYGRMLKDSLTPDILWVPFPYHVADLRRRREQQVLLAPRKDDSGGLLKPADSLPIQARDPAREILPSFSDLESASIEPLLESVLASLARERVRYVGIVATDIRDTIFLALEIRKHAPNAAVFTLTADNLYLHSSVHSRLQGMLVLGTYPLFPPNRLWTYPFQRDVQRLQFPTANAQGVYNATLRLLDLDDRMLEVDEPFSQDRDPNRPLPVWLTAVGGDGLWPIALLGEKRNPTTTISGGDRSKVDLGSGLSEGGPAVLLVLWCLTGLLAAFEMRKFLPPQPPADTRPGSWSVPSLGTARLWIQWLLRGPQPGRDMEQQLNVLAAFTALLDVHLLVLGIWCLPYAALTREPAGLDLVLGGIGWATVARVVPVLFAGLVAVVLGIGLACADVRIIGRVLREGLPGASGRWTLYVFAMCQCTVALSVWQGISWLSLEPASGMFLFVRATSTGSGYSPLTPSILAGLAIFSLVCCTLRRTHLREEGVGRAGPGGRGGGFMHEVSQHEWRILDLFRRTLNELPGVFSVLTLFSVILVALLSTRWAPTVEEYPFDFYFKVAWGMAYLVAALEFVRFMEGWSRLRKLLWLLRHHPSFSAYRELRELPTFPRSTLTMRTSLVGALTVCVDRARELVRVLGRGGAAGALGASPKSQADRLPGRLQELQRSQESALTALHRGERTEYLLSLRASLDSLDALTSDVARLCEPYWTPETTPPAQDHKAAKCEQEIIRLGHQLLASRFVLFIQQTIRHLQNQIAFITITLLLMLLAATSYPFQPRGWLLLFNWSLIMTMVLAVLATFLQMSRNEVLSELSGTTPGAVSVDRQLVGRVLVYGLVPIVGLLRAQYPGAFEQLISWFHRLLGGGE